MSVYHSVLNVKALVGAFNQEKALVGAFSVIVKTGCGTDGALHSTNYHISRPELATRKQCPPGEISESRRNMCVLCEHYDINQ